MSRSTIEGLRLPAAAVLIVVVAFVLWPRAGETQSTVPSPTLGVIVGEPGGGVFLPSVEATPIPTLTPAPSPTPVVPDTFSAEVFACRSISGPECDDEVGRLRKNARSVTALVLFTDARAGDAIDVRLSGQGVEVSGGAYALEGDGDGYYYATFRVEDLVRGEYTLTATRNGVEVATTSFTKRGD
jgi:hypothetical protein